MLSAGPIPRPVDAIRILSQSGLSLKRARSIIDRLGTGEHVPVEVSVEEPMVLITKLAALGIAVRAFKDTKVDVRRIREHQHLSQPDFAAMYNLELDTLQNWEQGRNTPDTPAMVLLRVIEKNPTAVLEAITEHLTEATEALERMAALTIEGAATASFDFFSYATLRPMHPMQVDIGTIQFAQKRDNSP